MHDDAKLVSIRLLGLLTIMWSYGCNAMMGLQKGMHLQVSSYPKSSAVMAWGFHRSNPYFWLYAVALHRWWTWKMWNCRSNKSTLLQEGTKKTKVWSVKSQEVTAKMLASIPQVPQNPWQFVAIIGYLPPNVCDVLRFDPQERNNQLFGNFGQVILNIYWILLVSILWESKTRWFWRMIPQMEYSNAYVLITTQVILFRRKIPTANRVQARFPEKLFPS